MRKAVTKVWQSVMGYFLAGVVAVLPLVITAGVVIWLVGFLEGLIGPTTFLGEQLRTFGLHFSSNTTFAYVIGWLIVLGIVFLLGFLVEMGAKDLFGKIVDAVVSRIPLMGSVYGTSKQLVDMLDKKQQSDLQGMGVVFCIFGKDNGAGVLALMPTPKKFHLAGRDYQVVIIPTAPVPFGGGLFFVPVECVKPAEMSVDGLMSIYVSMGVTAPQYLQETPPKASS